MVRVLLNVAAGAGSDGAVSGHASARFTRHLSAVVAAGCAVGAARAVPVQPAGALRSASSMPPVWHRGQ